ncbi:hypothetical protein [Mastigocoleus sp. MO_188.B34]|uniref:hypothetical protein n=1 Tax=Mastigocoleus sp. MO_188.B34 TaxID=3036635 RepID=UPI00261B2CD7|nr:hypothetical protein [Mastigocoleus sp. MO_188.B34]MDJ0694074.1 hypothetical protein [Mastigocoleus sp. MO_188.B34]
MKTNKKRFILQVSVAIISLAIFGSIFSLIFGNIFSYKKSQKPRTAELLVNPTSNPILGLIPDSEESRHVEYPSVIKVDEEYLMYYSAYGDDQKWRIFLATSDDGSNFERHGWVFDVKNLPKNCQGNQAFPFVVQDQTKSNSFLMYFSCAFKRAKPYDNILWASSPDGKTWKYGGVAIEGAGLDPLVML